MPTLQIICPYCGHEIKSPKKTAVSERDQLVHTRCALRFQRKIG